MKDRTLFHWIARCVAISAALLYGEFGTSTVEATLQTCTSRCEHGEDAGCAEPTQHANWISLPKNGGSDLHSECNAGNCAAGHSCAPDPEEEQHLVESIDAAVERSDFATLEAALRENADKVALNTERQAVQVLSCSGSVAAHFPAAASLVNALAHSTAK